MHFNKDQQAFLTLVRAGLWEEEAQLLQYGGIDYNSVYRLAQEQSVTGLVAAGLEHVLDTKVPQEIALTFAGDSLQLEQRNTAMNAFIANLIGKMRSVDIYTLLVKGQGIAQCYERPLWRTCGDVDFLLSEINYQKAVNFLTPIANSIDEEHSYIRHLALTIGHWEVELHGTLRSKLGRRIDRVLDEVQNEVFCGGAVRSWMNNDAQIFIPRADEDVIFVFSHILQHFFNGGIGLRQICDWCRLLWTYRKTINHRLLESRIKKMGILSEWRAFAYLAVNTLGMPEEAMPMYSPSRKWQKKAGKVMSCIFETGNMGHNRDVTYRESSCLFKRKITTLYRVSRDSFHHFLIFPKDSIRVWWKIITKGIFDTARGKIS